MVLARRCPRCWLLTRKRLRRSRRGSSIGAWRRVAASAPGPPVPRTSGVLRFDPRAAVPPLTVFLLGACPWGILTLCPHLCRGAMEAWPAILYGCGSRTASSEKPSAGRLATFMKVAGSPGERAESSRWAPERAVCRCGVQRCGGENQRGGSIDRAAIRLTPTEAGTTAPTSPESSPPAP